ncbi:MAG: penicillin acylase family protein [Gemmatimonadaceae bacterium]
MISSRQPTMLRRLRSASFLVMLVTGAERLESQQSDTLHLRGLQGAVEVLRDAWGVAHIYARNEHDLFFAQGYTAARDRAFQFEMWRRQATGTVAALLGKREAERDLGARLFRFRGDMTAELAHYHPHGAAIVGAFVEGINAYVDAAAADSSLIPIELRMLGAKPQRWTVADVISRHQGLLGNLPQELEYGRFVARFGSALLRKVEWFHPGPGEPALDLDPSIDKAGLAAPILALYDAYRGPIRFEPNDIQLAYRADSANSGRLAKIQEESAQALRTTQRRDIGSNNWVVSGRLTMSGRTLMANDPHRAESAPSLRYFVHLVAPGWNVIGGGEPTVPGVSIGHNEYGAWGLTIFSTDGEDLYVYKTNPANRSQYRFRGTWESMRTIRESIEVRGEGRREVTLKYTRHGPVVYEDSARGVAYAVRAAWMEPGGAPYLSALRMDQARSWEEFRAACSYGNIPGENMVWADVKGNIGWQSVGIAPIRPASSGLVPVPGDGRFEWAGYLPVLQKPHSFNPSEGYIATANNNLTPESFPFRNAIGWEWADPYRVSRISEVLGSGRKQTVSDMERLQNDYTSLPARALVPLLRGLKGSNEASERARQLLMGWDQVLDKESVAAGIYEAWYRHLMPNTRAIVVPREAQESARGIPTKRYVEWLTAPGGEFGATPTAERDALLLRSLDEGVKELTQRFGADINGWAWGRYHHVRILHPMSAAMNEELRARFDVGTWPRGGDSNTPGMTTAGENQTAGASFRMIVEAGDWDGAVGTNTPGQSGDVNDPHYRDLFELWKDDKYFPVKYSRTAVESVTRKRAVLVPVSR